MCAKMIINAGIERVIFKGAYLDEFSLELFRESGIELFRFSEGELEPVH
jgi:dCMP deaminase